MALPNTKGHRIETYQPRRTRMAEITWPNQPPNTAIGAAISGSIPHTQIDIATIAKANPEMPCTRPATAAPNANSHNSDVMTGRECTRSEEHTSELQSQSNLVCRLLLEKKKFVPDDGEPGRLFQQTPGAYRLR